MIIDILLDTQNILADIQRSEMASINNVIDCASEFEEIIFWMKHVFPGYMKNYIREDMKRNVGFSVNFLIEIREIIVVFL